MKSELITDQKAKVVEKPFPKVMRGIITGVIIGFSSPNIGAVLNVGNNMSVHLFESIKNWDYCSTSDFEEMDEATIKFS